jgi:hypothetical protein
MESSIIFLWNGVLILNGKENKEAGAICFEIRIPRKKNNKVLRKVPSKIYGSNFIMEKTKNIFWFVNISEYHHQEMGLMYLHFTVIPKKAIWHLAIQQNWCFGQFYHSKI